jgi:hypothetical protein
MEFIVAITLAALALLGAAIYSNSGQQLSTHDQCVVDCMSEGSAVGDCKQACKEEK